MSAPAPAHLLALQGKLLGCTPLANICTSRRRPLRPKASTRSVQSSPVKRGKPRSQQIIGDHHRLTLIFSADEQDHVQMRVPAITPMRYFRRRDAARDQAFHPRPCPMPVQSLLGLLQPFKQVT